MITGVVLNDPSAVAETRRAAHRLAVDRHLGEDDVERVRIVATEMASNLVRHGVDGQLVIRPLGDAARGGVELLAFDRGPGIANLGDALRDGFSTGRTLGGGLGAIRRLANQFDIHSVLGKGTVVLARIWPGSEPAYPATAAGACAPAPGEEVCGDGWAWDLAGGAVRVLVVDGLGHGPLAADAARAAIAAFRQDPAPDLRRTVEEIHRALKATRGAAIALASHDGTTGLIGLIGIGNISAWVIGADRRLPLISHNGIAGHANPPMRLSSAPVARGDLLVLHTDGVAARWTLDEYPGLTARDPTVIATTIFRDHRRGTDDATVVVARVEGAP